MQKIKKFSQKHTFLYCILVELAFFVSMTCVGLLLNVIANGNTNSYVWLMIGEAVGAIFASAAIYITGNVSVLKNKGCGFRKGLPVGMFMLVISILNIIGSVTTFEGEKGLEPWYLIAAFIGCMICVGIAEEFLFRGVMATLFLEKFGTDKKGVWKAVIVSGVLFGFAHAANLFSSAPIGVLVQMVVASVMGMVLVIIYFRTGCIWVNVFLHALIDISAGFTTGLYGSGTLVDTISTYSWINLISCVPYLIVLLVLMRKRKIGEVEQNMGKLIDSLRVVKESEE